MTRRISDWSVFGRCGRCDAAPERPCQRLDGAGEASRQHPGRPMVDGTLRRAGRPILTSPSAARAQRPMWVKRVDEQRAAAVRHTQRAMQARVRAVKFDREGRCPYTPDRGGWQCTEDKGHRGDHVHRVEHLPEGYEL